MIFTFLFYEKSHGKQLRYTLGRYKHCDMLSYDGRDTLYYHLGARGINVRTITQSSFKELLFNLSRSPNLSAMITIERTKLSHLTWWPVMANSCAELCRKISGVDIGVCIFPSQLFRKLLVYNNCKNYEVIQHWSRDDGIRSG